MRRIVFATALIGSAAFVVVACGGGEQPAPQQPAAQQAAAPAAKVDPATAGIITGSIKLEGTPPKAEIIRMNSDPVCMRLHEGKNPTTEYFIVGEGNGLANVFVYVKEGLGNLTFDPPTTPVVLDQKGCTYHPHVFGIQVGQPLEILNSDPTLHNIHAVPKVNQEFNTGQPIQGMKFQHRFTAREVMVPFKCDVHGWMNAYAGVLDHPYFAVTGPDGKFELKNVPPGKYLIEAWHEKLGTTTQQVELGAKETKEVSFTFKTT
jgi:plastocyanin